MVNDDSDFGPLTPAALSLGLDSFDPVDEVEEISWLYRYLSSQITSFLAIRSPTSVRNLVYNLVSTLQDSQFKGVLFQALSRSIKKHPYDVAFVVVAAVLAAADEIVYTSSGATGMIKKPFPLELKVLTDPRGRRDRAGMEGERWRSCCSGCWHRASSRRDIGSRSASSGLG